MDPWSGLPAAPRSGKDERDRLEEEGELNRADRLEKENHALRDRLSRLSQASLRIHESLDYPTVLQGVLDSARSLTGARYGVMTFLDDAGWPRDFLSSGLTAEADRRLWDLPEGIRIYEYLDTLSSPLRLPDLLGHFRSQGLPEVGPALGLGEPFSFLTAPILHGGERAGNLYLGGKEPGEAFSRQDEETLVLFASQAGMVIANARKYRGRAAGPGRPGDPDRHLPGGRGRVRPGVWRAGRRVLHAGRRKIRVTAPVGGSLPPYPPPIRFRFPSSFQADSSAPGVGTSRAGPDPAPGFFGKSSVYHSRQQKYHTEITQRSVSWNPDWIARGSLARRPFQGGQSGPQSASHNLTRAVLPIFTGSLRDRARIGGPLNRGDQG